MNLTKCNSGHYYDADKYAACPHCNQVEEADDKTVFMEQTGTGSSSQAYSEPANTGRTDASSEKTFASNQSPTVPLNVAFQAAVVPTATDDDKTVSYYGGTLGTEPVVGWLVCVEGAMLGKAYELKNGKNFIGRSINMDVVLAEDPNVSRECHAIVIYEPKGRVFIAQPGEARELFYMNDQVVLMNREMRDRDILSLGKTKLMFVPLCGVGFAWEDVK